MEKEIKLNKLAYIPLGIFIVNFIIYLIIDVFGLIYTYSGTAKKIYLFFCFPINILGFIMTIYFLIKFLIFKKSFWNVILCLPLLVFIFYFYFLPMLNDKQ